MKNSGKRWAETTILAAAKRTGKSTVAEKIIANSSLSNALIYKMGVNVYDEAFKKYKVIEDLYKYKGGKVIVNGGHIEYRTFLDLCYKQYRNGILLIDDCGVFENNVPTPELRAILTDNRKLGIEVILVYHGLSKVPIEMFTFANNIILGVTTDNFMYKLNKLPDIEDQLLAAKARIDRAAEAGNRYYKEWIKLS